MTNLANQQALTHGIGAVGHFGRQALLWGQFWTRQNPFHLVYRDGTIAARQEDGEQVQVPHVAADASYEITRRTVSAEGLASETSAAISATIEADGDLAGVAGNAPQNLTAQQNHAGGIDISWQYDADNEPATPEQFSVSITDGVNPSESTAVIYVRGRRHYHCTISEFNTMALAHNITYTINVQTQKLDPIVNDGNDITVAVTMDLQGPPAVTTIAAQMTC